MARTSETVTVTHVRVVNDSSGGISFSISSRDEPYGPRALERAAYWCRHGYHLEVWEQIFTISPSEWRCAASDGLAAAKETK